MERSGAQGVLWVYKSLGGGGSVSAAQVEEVRGLWAVGGEEGLNASVSVQ